MSARTDMSLRHAPTERYELVRHAGADGRCLIRDAAGKTASVKAAWLVFEGGTCWPGGWRKAQHVKNAEWSAEGEAK